MRDPEKFGIFKNIMSNRPEIEKCKPSIIQVRHHSYSSLRASSEGTGTFANADLLYSGIRNLFICIKYAKLTCSVDRLYVFGICKPHLDFKCLQSFGLKGKRLLLFFVIQGVRNSPVLLPALVRVMS